VVLNLRLSVYGDAVRALLARGLKSKEDERQSAEASETSVFGLVFRFERREDALDDASAFLCIRVAEEYRNDGR